MSSGTEHRENLFKLAIEKLLAESSQKYHKNIRESLIAAQELLLKSPKSSETSVDNSEGNEETDVKQKSVSNEETYSSASFWPCLKLASGPGSSLKMREISLDMIEKLVAYGCFTSEEPLREYSMDMIRIPINIAPDSYSSDYNETLRNNPPTAPPRLIDEIVWDVSSCHPSVCQVTPSSSSYLSFTSAFGFSAPAVSETSSSYGAVELQIVKVLLTIATSIECNIHSYSLLRIFNCLYSIYLNTKHSINATTAKAALTQISNFIFVKVETAHLVKYENQNEKVEESTEISEEKEEISLEQYDCWLVIRYLCSCSMKFGTEETASSVEAKGRGLALELILSILNNVGLTFKNHPIFIELLQRDLCITLSKNGVQTNSSIFELSLSIFLMLLNYYRSPLKDQLEVLFNEIYLHLLEMSNSTPTQKGLVLEGLRKICNSPQVLTDLYVNYDCDYSMESIYERLISGLSKMGQGGKKLSETPSKLPIESSTNPAGDPHSVIERKLTFKSLKCLVSVVHSLVEWFRINSNDFKDVIDAGTTEILKSSADSFAALSQQVKKLESGPVVISKNPLSNVLSHPEAKTHPSFAENESNSQIYEQAKSRKAMLKQGINMFNNKPSSGIEFLISSDLLMDTPETIVAFIKNTDGLFKKAIGEYLGESSSNCIKIMHHFIDEMDFSGKTFVVALREFLQTFRLPGESQKIDRILEKFADRYCENNPKVFANADTAYTLSFAIMMLNTDLHSPAIKDATRMDKNAFIRNNRGINNNSDLPEELLSSIFDEIQSNEIVLEEEQMSYLNKLAEFTTRTSRVSDFNSTENLKKELYKKETDRMKAKSEAKMKGIRNSHPFRSATLSDHVYPMFQVTWGPLLAVLSVIFEEARDDEIEIVDLVLKGFVESIRLSCVFHMETVRESFISTLAKFTVTPAMSEIKPKNISAIKAIIHVTNSFGNYLESSWTSVIQCISRLEQIQLVELNQQNLLISGSTSLTSQTNSSTSSPAVEKGLWGEFQEQTNVVAMDRIFNNSTSLSGAAILSFFTALTTVSFEELKYSPPRMFCLQKILEIAYYNMSRIRLEWNQIWKILQPYFNEIGCNPNISVATFAIDALRQLSVKFLDKDELAHFHTQNEFLKSFEWIMRQNVTNSIRDLILQSFSQMIFSRARNIKSGWKSIFVVMGRAADESSLLLTAWELCNKIRTDEIFPFVVSNGFVDYISCIVEFALNENDANIAKDAVSVLVDSAFSLVSELKINNFHPSPTATPIEKYQLEDEVFFLKWFPVLSGMARIVTDSNISMSRSNTLETLFDILGRAGLSFNAHQWRSVYRSVLMPLFEELKDPDVKDTLRENSFTAIWIQALRLLVELLSSLYSILIEQHEFFDGILDLIRFMVLRKNENLSQAVVIFLPQMIQKNCNRFSDVEWTKITNMMCYLYEKTLPVELISFNPADASPSLPSPPNLQSTTTTSISSSTTINNNINEESSTLNAEVTLKFVEDTTESEEIQFENTRRTSQVDFRYSAIKCASHLALVNIQNEISLGSKPIFWHMKVSLQKKWLDSLMDSYMFASDFNKNYSLRHKLWKAGFVNQLENLVLSKQETFSMYFYIAILFNMIGRVMHSDENSPQQQQQWKDIKEWAPASLKLVVENSLDKYINLLASPGGPTRRELINWSPLIIRIFTEISSWYPVALESLAKGNSHGSNCFEAAKVFLENAKFYHECGLKIVQLNDDLDVKRSIIEFLKVIGAWTLGKLNEIISESHLPLLPSSQKEQRTAADPCNYSGMSFKESEHYPDPNRHLNDLETSGCNGQSEDAFIQFKKYPWQAYNPLKTTPSFIDSFFAMKPWDIFHIFVSSPAVALLTLARTPSKLLYKKQINYLPSTGEHRAEIAKYGILAGIFIGYAAAHTRSWFRMAGLSKDSEYSPVPAGKVSPCASPRFNNFYKLENN